MSLYEIYLSKPTEYLINKIFDSQEKIQKLQHQLEIQTKRVENLKKMFMYGDVDKYTFLEVEKDQKDYHVKDVWMMEEESDFDQLGERVQWGVTVPKMVGGKLARSCQAIDQELEKELENLK